MKIIKGNDIVVKDQDWIVISAASVNPGRTIDPRLSFSCGRFYVHEYIDDDIVPVDVTDDVMKAILGKEENV